MVNCGVYIIINNMNQKIYVGSSNDLKRRRREHFSRLRINEHNNLHLQRSFNKYGEDSFTFEILEHSSENKRIELEQYYIDYFETYEYKLGYNGTRNVSPLNENIFTPERIHKYIMSRGAKKFHAFDRNKNYYGTWFNKLQCSKDLGLKKPNSANIIECLNWHVKTVNDKILIYDHELYRLDEKIQWSIIAKTDRFAIFKDNEILDVFTNQRECARKYDLDFKKISLCLKKEYGRQTHKGYHFDWIKHAD